MVRPAVVRADIQALRAVAVLSVVTYHLWPTAVPGGYTGVDVFFVISGFLITAHLDREVLEHGRVRLAVFWGRRIRRLLPAASVVLLFSLLIMVAVVPHVLWQRTVTEIAASALYVQNWVLAANSVDYLSADGAATIVQHFWSLSVEEQFYLVWPVLILLMLWMRRGRLVALGIVFAASLVYSVLDTEASAYFSTATRAWEFAAGGLLALAPIGLPRIARRVASWIGVALIATTLATFTPATPFPSGWALLPVLGSAFVIAGAGAGFGRVVAWRPIQFVGDVSYSLYLWHWPLVVAAPYLLARPLTMLDRVLILAISLGLAAATKRLVEDPARRASRLSRPRGAFLLAAGTVGLLLVSSGTVWASVQVATFAAANSVASAERSPCFGAQAMAGDCARPYAVPSGFDAAFWAADKGSLGSCNSDTEQVEPCAYGDLTDPAQTIALVGNSHAGHLVAGLDAYGKAHHWKIVLMRKTGCAGTLTDVVVPAVKLACIHWSRNVDAALRDPANQFSSVVFASNVDAAHYLARSPLTTGGTQAVITSMVAHFAALESDGLSVVVLGDVPGAVPEVVPECVEEHLAVYDPCSTPRASSSGDLVVTAAQKTAGVGYIDLTPWFCDATACHVVIGGALVYLDGHHLTATFSRSLGPFIGAALAARLHE